MPDDIQQNMRLQHLIKCELEQQVNESRQVLSMMQIIIRQKKQDT
jgi:hypothetical protein